MTDDTLRSDLEAAAAETAMAETPEAHEETFEQFAARSMANGGSLEAINLVRLIETEFPFFQDERNLNWAVRAAQIVAQDKSSLLGDGSDLRTVLRTLQSHAEAADSKRAERTSVDRKLKTLGDLLTRTETLVASRRKH